MTKDEMDALYEEAFEGLGIHEWLRRNPPPMTRRRRIFMWVCIVAMVVCAAAMAVVVAVHWNDPRPTPKEAESMNTVEVYEADYNRDMEELDRLRAENEWLQNLRERAAEHERFRRALEYIRDAVAVENHPVLTSYKAHIDNICQYAGNVLAGGNP